MNRTVHLLLGVVLVGALTGCTSNQSGVGSPSAAPQSSASDDRNEQTSIDPLGTATPDASPAEEETKFLEELGVNDHGNIGVEDEEPAVFKDPGTDTEFAQFTATNVTANFQCTADGALPPVNGQYVALNFDVKANDDLPDSGFPYFYLTVHDFRAWDAEGDRIADPVGNAETCINPDQRVPSPVEPGDDASGLVVLDVPSGSGSASFTMGGYQGSYGWEWDW